MKNVECCYKELHLKGDRATMSDSVWLVVFCLAFTCSKLIKTLEQRLTCSGVFINFELWSTVIIAEFKQINVNKFAFNNCEKYVVLWLGQFVGLQIFIVIPLKKVCEKIIQW